MKFFFLLFIFITFSLRSQLMSERIISNNNCFEENKGQIKSLKNDDNLSDVKFVFKANGLTIFLLKNGISYQFNKYSNEIDPILNTPLYVEMYRMNMVLKNYNQKPEIIKENEVKEINNYPSKNVLNVKKYKKIIYKNIYPNIDWVLRFDSLNKLKYYFIIHPNADINNIQMEYLAADSILFQENNLKITCPLGHIIDNAPISFQDGNIVSSNFILNKNIVHFDIKQYNNKKELIIDPTIEWATYYGGENDDEIKSSVFSNSGYLYIVGNTKSSNFIATLGSFKSTFNVLSGLQDIFISKLTSTGLKLWSTYYGGEFMDVVYNCSLDKSQHVYIVGYTNSNTGISFNGFKNTKGISNDGFILKLDSNGNRIWASYYGGDKTDNIFSCVNDTNDNLLILGITNSTNGISTIGSFKPNLFGKNDTSDAFLAKFNPIGIRLWGTYIGGEDIDDGSGITSDASNNIYICGKTSSSTNIKMNTSSTTNFNNGSIAYIQKFDSTGKKQWGSYFGTNKTKFFNIQNTINSIIVSGITFDSIGIADSNSYQPHLKGISDFVIAKFDLSGNKIWSTYFGGMGQENVAPFSQPNYSKDTSGSAYISGLSTSNTEFINNLNLDTCYYCNSAGFLFKISNIGIVNWARIYYMGSSNVFSSNSRSLSGDIYCCGGTAFSTVILNGINPTSFGSSDGLIVKYNCKADTTLLDSSICQGVFSFFNSTKISISGTYKDTFVNKFGCDSFIFLTLTVHSRDTTRIDTQVCRNRGYWFKNKLRDTSGIYRDTLSNRYGCDSFVILTLTVVKNDTTRLYDTICSQNTKTFYTQKLTTSGIYTHLDTNRFGCDSLIILYLSVNKRDTIHIFDTTCSTIPKLFNNLTLSISGIYRKTLTNSKGCDSFIFYHLQVFKADTTSLSKEICQGNSEPFFGQNLTTSGTYTHLLQNQKKCDSLILLRLSVSPPYHSTIDTHLCYGQSYRGHSSSGVFQEKFQTILGCDSILDYKITLSPPPIFDTIRLNSCSDITLNGTTYNSSQSISNTIKSQNLCDSIVRTYQLTIQHIVPLILADTWIYFCDTTSYKSHWYRDSRHVYDTTKSAVLPYCDSLFQKVELVKVDKPILQIQNIPTDSLVRGQVVSLQANSFRHYLWSTGDQNATLVKEINNDTLFTIKVWDYTGCEDSASIYLKVKNRTYVGIPTAFSPNGDGKNDYFELDGCNTDYQILSAQIFNRWGEKVYESAPSKAIKWDGTFKGTLVPTGVYTYSIVYRYLPLSQIEERKGTVTVVW